MGIRNTTSFIAKIRNYLPAKLSAMSDCEVGGTADGRTDGSLTEELDRCEDSVSVTLISSSFSPLLHAALYWYEDKEGAKSVFVLPICVADFAASCLPVPVRGRGKR